jgi:hypothetical protein
MVAIARPWALMRRHAGWADIFLIEAETADGVSGVYPDRAAEERVSYTAFAVLARFATVEAAREARERALAERRRHDGAVDAADAALKAAEQARDAAWVAALKGAAEG